jgi:hypothetical protein
MALVEVFTGMTFENFGRLQRPMSRVVSCVCPRSYGMLRDGKMLPKWHLRARCWPLCCWRVAATLTFDYNWTTTQSRHWLHVGPVSLCLQ